MLHSCIFVAGLKNAAFVLSSLNAAVVTYALHRRTTSMGRHRADSSLNSEGSSILQLPAFDTMMRVLSMGQNSSQVFLSNDAM